MTMTATTYQKRIIIYGNQFLDFFPVVRLFTVIVPVITPTWGRTENDGFMHKDDKDSEDGDSYGMSIEELIYSSSSYYAIVKPVTLTMILTVVFINDNSTRQAGEAAIQHQW